MSRVELRILKVGSTAASGSNGSNIQPHERAIVNKWKFQDSMMGEQFITFTLTSEKPIDWAVGDYCVFRGETFTLNYVPSATQKARTGERQDAYTYESVKFDSCQEELTRVTMLDITSTTGSYVAAMGTNYTGSSRFQLFCGETTANGITLPAVCVLAAKMQANLDRAYPSKWRIEVDTTSTYTNASGTTELVTRTEDKVMSFDNTTIAEALSEVNNTFGLDYCVKGRTIYIGYNLKNLTSDYTDETFVFGYGKGYPHREDMNKGLFQIKRISNSSQKIVTRLRALGSTKNIPYRYYNERYNLPQSMFPTNLQLPDTFATPAVKADNNSMRDSQYGINELTGLPFLRHVKGDSNDAYIDKNDNADGCPEGMREHSACWDGSGDLPEIFPTIEEVTYGELRGTSVKDQDGATGVNAFPGYGDDEHIDELLAIGYLNSKNVLVDDANDGDGILPENYSGSGIPKLCHYGVKCHYYNVVDSGDFTTSGNYSVSKEEELFTIENVFEGKYSLVPSNGDIHYFPSFRGPMSNGASAEVGFIITIKQTSKVNGTTKVIARYQSDFVKAYVNQSGETIKLPTLPDVSSDSNYKTQVEEIHVTEFSDITVTLTTVIKAISFAAAFTGNVAICSSVTTLEEANAPEYTWLSVDGKNDNGAGAFHVFIKDMGFDLTACFTGDTPVLVMKSGRCVAREFEIGENIEPITYDGKKGYMLALNRATDSTLNTFYPSATDPIAAGDKFVLLNINMPDSYVQSAEVRLLRAATDFLADNCTTQFTYQPYIDDIYLQRNYDNMLAAGTPENSILWRLYAGLKFTFRGIPDSDDEASPLVDLTIEQVTINMGDGLTPKVEMTLNDDIQQTTLQKLTTSVDRIYNGSLFSSGSGGTNANAAAILSILESEGGKLFVSKREDDVVDGKIIFNDVTTHNAPSKFKKGLTVGNFNSRMLGSGAIIDEHGNAEFESIYSRNFISTPEYRFNRVGVTEGEQWCTNGYGTILAVEKIDDTTGYITLKLEENDYASVLEGDICRGIYNDISCQYETRTLDDDSPLYGSDAARTDVLDPKEGSGFGFSSKAGFFTSYFWIKQMVMSRRGECKFLYELRNARTPHPCEFMKFAQYGSFTNASRRSSSYSTSIGHYYEMVLDGVSTWKIHSANVVYRKGYLGDMTVALNNGNEATLHGYGLYVQDNVYFGNAIVQLDPVTLEDITAQLSNYTVEFSEHVDMITVDDVGNAIGGLYTIDGDARRYRIHSAITVRNNNNILTIAEDDEDAGVGTYKVYAQGNGCDCVIEDSTLYITSIDNIKDGVSGSGDDVDFDYDAMRLMESCCVDLIIDCEGKGSIMKSFPISIKHSSQPYIAADLDNKTSTVSWNTKDQMYIGQPIEISVLLWHNNETLDITSLFVNGKGLEVQGGVRRIETPEGIRMFLYIERNGIDQYWHGRIAIIDPLPANLPLVTTLNITCTAVYAGVSYERTLVHTINKVTDLNVYSLLPSVDEVVVNKNTDTLSDDFITCSVICDSTDHKHYTVGYNDFATHGLALYYRKFYTDGTSDKDETMYDNTAISVNSGVAKVAFNLYGLTNGTVDRTIIHDSEDVPMIASGVDGSSVEFIFIAVADWDGTEEGKPTIYDEKLQSDDYQPYTDATKKVRWTDDPVGVSATLQYEFYAQRKKVNGVWGAFGSVRIWDKYVTDGINGHSQKSIFKNSFAKPSVPSQTYGTDGWSDDCVPQIPVDALHQGDWVIDADGWYTAPPIGNNQSTEQFVQFITTENNQDVYVCLKANIANMDLAFVSHVDATDTSIAYLGGWGQSTGNLLFQVANPGTHVIRIWFIRADETYTDKTCYVKYKFGNMPTWKSDSKEYDEEGNVTRWSEPYKVSDDTVQQQSQMRPNLLYQTSFVPTNMSKWTREGDKFTEGYVTNGLNGINAYAGKNDDAGNYKELLKQLVYNSSTTHPNDCPIRPNTWYTLSFWAKADKIGDGNHLSTYLYPNKVQETYTYIDVNSGLFVDGDIRDVTNDTDNCVYWKLNTQWMRHWMAFKTRDFLPDANQQLLFRLLPNAGTVYICMPKLEQGIGATDYITNDEDLVNRAASESGFPNNRGQWKGNTSNDPLGRYKWNGTRRDYVTHSIDGVSYAFFVKEKGLEVPDGNEPVSGGNYYWEQGNKVSTLLANTIIGENVELGGFLASGDTLKSKNGKLELDGLEGLIKLLHDDGYSWQVLKNGMQVLGVYPSGQHIQLDPEAKEIRLYNESGACVTKISGDTVESLSNIFGNSLGNITPSSTYKTKTVTLTQNNTDYTSPNFKDDMVDTNKYLLGSFNTNSETRVTVLLSARVNGPQSTTPPEHLPQYNGSGQIMVMPGGLTTDGWLRQRNVATVKVFVDTYADSGYKTLKKAIQLYSLTSSGNGEISQSDKSVVGDLVSGYHKIYVEYYLLTPGYQSTSYQSLRTATVYWNVTSISYASEIYLSRLFANGMAYGTSINNFFAAMNVGNAMQIKGVTLNESGIASGFDLSSTGLSILFKGSYFRPVITLGMGVLQYNSGTTSWKSFQNGLRNSANPTVSCSSQGYYTITFPSAWKNIIGDNIADALLISVFAIDVISTQANPTITMFTTVSNDNCVIKYKCSTSAAQEKFFVKFEYMLP